MKFLAVVSIFTKLLTGPPDTTVAVLPKYDLRCSVIDVCHPYTQQTSEFIYDQEIYHYGCDTLSQVKFWRQIMRTNQDSSIVNIAANRQIVQKISNNDWKLMNDSIKNLYKDSVRVANQLCDSARILITGGKSFFYDFDNAYTNFDRGIKAFVQNGVDPWYAQAILLIESPNKLQKSNAGAYGSFQLMKDVARLYGLKVNRQIDERADFDRSAYAASSLIKTICIPKTKQILDSLRIPYREDELWFKLLVMHSYHAGAGNVRKALFSFMPTGGGMPLIYTLWRTETSKFRSASQNYSQLVLAAMLEMNDRLQISRSVTAKATTDTAEAPTKKP